MICDSGLPSLLPKLKRKVAEMRSWYYRAGAYRRDLRLLKEVREVDVSEQIELLDGLLEEATANIACMKVEAFDLASTILLEWEEEDKYGQRHKVWKSMAYLFDDTYRSWRLAQLKRLSGKRKRTEEENLALSILRQEIQGLY